MKTEKRISRRILLIAGFVLAAVVLFYFLFIPSAVQIEIKSVEKGLFRETMQADGVLRSKEHHTVTAFADGDLKRMPFKVGDPVKKGQALTQLLWDIRYQAVRAPVAGVIAKVHRESAGPIRRGEPIVEIVDPESLEIVAEVLTTDAVRLEPGMAVFVQNWPAESEAHARISRVSKAGFVKQSALGVEEEKTEVTAELLNPSRTALAKAGNTFHVDLIFQLSQTPDVLKIPVGALFRKEDSWAVYVVEKGRALLKTVTIRAMNATEAQVLSGLSAGEQVIVYPGELIKEGTRVRPSPDQ